MAFLLLFVCKEMKVLNIFIQFAAVTASFIIFFFSVDVCLSRVQALYVGFWYIYNWNLIIVIHVPKETTEILQSEHMAKIGGYDESIKNVALGKMRKPSECIVKMS